jgi:hypothetical protein
MSDAYLCTTGRMLHLYDCPHFEMESHVREATDEERRTLPVCSDCIAGATRSTRPRALGHYDGSANEFTRPTCHMRKLVAQRAHDGRFVDCVEPADV